MPNPEQDRPSQAEIDAHYADRLHQAWSDAKDVFEIGAKVVVTRGWLESMVGHVVGAGVSLDTTDSLPLPKAWISVSLGKSRPVIIDYSVNDLAPSK